jgi:hypothetical protein
MAMVYRTEELIQILANERQACMRGKRLSLHASPTGFNPLLDKFLRPEGIQKFTAYNDFRATIHDYQREHQVSGIVWQQIQIRGETLRFPKVDDQLIAIPADVEILRSAKDAIVHFWRKVITGLDLYLSVNHGKDHQQITLTDVNWICQKTEWANLWKHENSNFLEIILQLGWGKPEEAVYKRGFPDSGSEYIHAVNPGMRPIC